jgi:hypothetical protein
MFQSACPISLTILGDVDGLSGYGRFAPKEVGTIE